MFKMYLRQNDAFLAKLRALPDRALIVLRRKIVTVLGPEIEQMTLALFAEGPLPVSKPFKFNSKASQGFYFAVIGEFPDLTAGGHWLRGGEMGIEANWRAQVSDRLRGAQIKIANILREDKLRAIGARAERGKSEGVWPGQFVFGDFVVAGHMSTGWPAFVEAVRQKLEAKMVERIQELWHESVIEAWHGRTE